MSFFVEANNRARSCNVNPLVLGCIVVDVPAGTKGAAVGLSEVVGCAALLYTIGVVTIDGGT